MFHAIVHTSNTTQTSMPPVGFFFFVCPRFFPLIQFCTVLNPFVLHVTFTFHTTVFTTNTTQTSMPPLGFEPTILASERPQTHALDRTATGIGQSNPGLRGERPATNRLSHGTADVSLEFGKKIRNFCTALELSLVHVYLKYILPLKSL
jgi:hypothetical protein